MREVHNEESSTRASIRRVGMVIDDLEQGREGKGRSELGEKTRKFSFWSRVQSKRDVRGEEGSDGGEGRRERKEKSCEREEERRSTVEVNLSLGEGAGPPSNLKEVSEDPYGDPLGLFITEFLSCIKERRRNPGEIAGRGKYTSERRRHKERPGWTQGRRKPVLAETLSVVSERHRIEW